MSENVAARPTPGGTRNAAKGRPAGAARKRTTGGSGAARSSGDGQPLAQRETLRFYTDDAPGLKIGPTMVLVLSLLFIGFVVLLHIYGKMTAAA